MCGVRVFVNTAKKCGRCVFANLLRQQMAASRMLVEKRSDVVNETGYEDQGSGLRLFLDYGHEMRRPSEGDGVADKTHNSDTI